MNLWEETFEETEVAAGDAFDGGDGLRVSEVVGVEGLAELAPLTFEDEQQLVVAEGAVLVGEPESAVELWVVSELLLDAGHADQDHRDACSVVLVAEPLDGVAGEAFGLIDDDQLEQ